ncbi:helix-turn-helix domain-containing protein [Brachybacterium hainanense]|uniref:Helix-turn-helix domain-containing protein n=1 Tax=Brachybacterium hainanense TaxID=1541174 RepID=A0ABV6R7T9_9MICO
MSTIDPLRRMLDAVLDPESGTLEEMSAGAHLSPYHFHRSVRRGTGETPAALRRRVGLEQAAWNLQRGMGVTDAAFAAGYDSLEGFSRAFRRAYGHPPTAMPPAHERGHWLPAPNGIHFHSPTVLYVDSGAVREHAAGDVLALLIAHDLDDIDALLGSAAGLEDEAYRRIRLPGSAPRAWDGPDESLAQVMRHLVLSKEPWLASIEGEPAPDLDGPVDVPSLQARHRTTAPRWLALVRDIERRGAWQDRIIDALCDPPESFLLAEILAHELTFSAHRRQLARWMLAEAGAGPAAAPPDPDPILWRRRTLAGGTDPS